MKINENWLREFVNPSVDCIQLAEQLTMSGLEVEEVNKINCLFDNVVVAKVESIKNHPESNKLNVCQVNDGGKKILTVVCGANNVKKGLNYPLAREGATLPGNIKISAIDLKGVTSEGMLCSEAELGLADEAEGLMNLPPDVEPGTNVADLLKLEDHILEIALTPNRGDCLSVLGIAREVAVLNNCKLNLFQRPELETSSKAKRKIKIEAPADCPRYCGRVIEKVDLDVPTPLWIKERLRRCGIRSVNVVVDITNYVMLELGQPMHAFDNDKLAGNVIVRFAQEGEQLKLLDGQINNLSENTLVISDEKNVLAMAGIMGGYDSAVSEMSENIFLESAYFRPKAITGQARSYGLHTDSSHRFERGVDYELPLLANLRATQLILSICGGQAGPLSEVRESAYIPENTPVILRRSRLLSVIGADIPDKQVNEILNNLGMQVTFINDEWTATAPSYRYDIEIEADLIEEVARIYGYNNLPDQQPVGGLSFTSGQALHTYNRALGGYLADRGYFEAITFSFVDDALQSLINPELEAIRLANPIASELGVMRTSLIPGLLQALLYNQNRQQQQIRLFETGLVFMPGDIIRQIPKFGGVVTGNIHEKQWDKKEVLGDFFDIKADIEGLFQKFGFQNQYNFVPNSITALHPGVSAEILLNNQPVGYIGELHPGIQKKLGITQTVFIFEIEISCFSKEIDVKYKEISKFPAIKRDISIVVEDHILVADIENCIGNSAPDLLKNLQLFDVFRGESIDLGKKSLAIGLTFQRSSSTLIDEEVDDIMEKILNRLTVEFGATLRE